MDSTKMAKPVPYAETGLPSVQLMNYRAASLMNEVYVSNIRLEGGSNVSDSGSIDDSHSANGEDASQAQRDRRRKIRKILNWFKITLLSCCWGAFTLLLMFKHVREVAVRQLSVPTGEDLLVGMQEWPISQELALKLNGPFVPPMNNTGYVLRASVLKLTTDANGTIINKQSVSDEWEVHLVQPQNIDNTFFILLRNIFKLSVGKPKWEPNTQYVFLLKTNSNQSVPLELRYTVTPIPVTTGTIVALVLLVGMCVLIIWRLVHYTMAVVFASTLSIGLLAYWHMRPPLPIIVSWIQTDQLMVLFSITIIVAVTADSGVLDYLIVLGYEMSNGHIWPLLNCMLLLTLISAAFLDTICMLMFIVPVQIKLCEVLELNPAPVLMCLVIAANIGQVIFPNEDSIQVSTTASEAILLNIFGYSSYIAHMAPVLLVIIAVTYLHLRLQFFDSSSMHFSGGLHAQRLKRVIRHWEHTANTMSGYSKDEKVIHDTVMSKARRMRLRLRRIGRLPLPPPHYDQVLRQLKDTYYIHQKPLFYKCLIVLIFIIVLATTNWLPAWIGISLPLCWITMLGANLLLILADIDELEGMLARIDWSTMLFLAALDILVHALGKFGLLDSINQWAQHIIKSSEPKTRLNVAILTILWISGLMSAVLVDVPVITNKSLVMQIIYSVKDGDKMSLPMEPLVWAMFLGAVLGSNGTIIGAAVNIVVGGAAEKHGYDFSFWYFFKIGFPIMIQNLLIATAYLWICHVVYEWH